LVTEYGLPSRLAQGRLEDWYGKARTGEMQVAAVNEMLHFSIFSPRDGHYGEPPTVSCVEEVLGNQNMKLMTLTYFDRNGVPRLAIVVEGDELSEGMVKELKTWADSQDKLEAMNEVLVLQCPPGTSAKFEKLASEQLSDAGFTEYKRMNDEGIMRAHRTPESVIATASNSNRAESAEANGKFITGVVRPRQKAYMSKINYLLREELDITDWVFDLNVPDLETQKVKAEIAEIYMRAGARTINEVRRTDGLAGIEGGDEAHRAIPGTGIVFVRTFSDLARRAEENGLTEDGVAGTAGQKTPAKGVDVTMGTGE
jgi:HK97 family phage portal protein